MNKTLGFVGLALLLIGSMVPGLMMANAVYTTTMGRTDPTTFINSLNWGIDQGGGAIVTAPAGVNTLTSVSAYLKYTTAATLAKFCVWDTDGSTRTLLGVGTTPVLTIVGYVWYTVSFSPSISITEGHQYIIGLVSNASMTTVAGLNAGTDTYAMDSTNSYATPVTMGTGVTTNTRDLAIYATCTGPAVSRALANNVVLMATLLPLVMVITIFKGLQSGANIQDAIKYAVLIGVIGVFVGVFYSMGV